MDIRLYTLRYKSSRQSDVARGFIEVAVQDDQAKMLAEAVAKGQWFCMKEPNVKYINVEPAILVKLHDGPGTLVGKVSAAVPDAPRTTPPAAQGQAKASAKA
jgi:hypothetical protein